MLPPFQHDSNVQYALPFLLPRSSWGIYYFVVATDQNVLAIGLCHRRRKPVCLRKPETYAELNVRLHVLLPSLPDRIENSAAHLQLRKSPLQVVYVLKTVADQPSPV